MVRPDGRLPHTRRDNGILPVFCPTGQMGFVKSKKRNANKLSATVHGVVFAIFIVRPQNLSERTCLVKPQSV
jgi:hypothetical protein